MTLERILVLVVVVESNPQALGGIPFTFQYPTYFYNIIISIETVQFYNCQFEFCTLHNTHTGDAYIDDLCE
jgi:hypothetical protein